MKPLLKNWFAEKWQQATMRLRVAGEYNALRGSKHMLADIAARNHVFSELPNDPHLMAIGEGRRRAALEILELARVDIQEIAQVRFTIPEDNRRVT
jgi:hypothetical protein